MRSSACLWDGKPSSLENLHIDQHAMDAVGRLGGHSYTRTLDQFEVRTPTVEEWHKGVKPFLGE